MSNHTHTHTHEKGLRMTKSCTGIIMAVTLSLFIGMSSAKAQGPQRTLVKVGATWCPPCRKFDRDLYSNNNELMSWIDNRFARFSNLDHKDEAAGKHNVRTLPTFIVLDGAGREVARWTGYSGPESFKRIASKHLF